MQTSGGRSWTYKGWNGFSDFSLSSIGFLFYFNLFCGRNIFEIYFGGGGLLNRRYCVRKILFWDSCDEEEYSGSRSLFQLKLIKKIIFESNQISASTALK